LYERTVCRSSRLRKTCAPVIADNRSLICSGVGVTTGAIRFAAPSMSAADSGGLFGRWLGSADTG
jgi:hypothetical protein